MESKKKTIRTDVLITPMTRKEYDLYRGWEFKDYRNDDANEEGYMVEFLDIHLPNHHKHDNLIKWYNKEDMLKTFY